MRCIPMLTDASALEMAERVGDGLWRLPTSIVRFSGSSYLRWGQ